MAQIRTKNGGSDIRENIQDIRYCNKMQRLELDWIKKNIGTVR